MDSESAAEGLVLLDSFSESHEAFALGNFNHVPGRKGTCIGDCAATISEKVLRLVAFQVAGCIGEIKDWVSDAVRQLRQSGAHVGIFTETRVHTQDRHTRIVNEFSSCGYLALSHNTTPRAADFVPDSLEEAMLVPRAAGVIIVVLDSYASGWSDIAYDLSGTAIAADIDLSDGSTVRVVAAYGVSGANCANFTSFPANKNR